MKPNNKVRVVWDCPVCGSRGGYGGPNKDLLMGLCVPVDEDYKEAICLACGWKGSIEDAEITAVEITNV
jgi:hypothetical protein